MSSKTALKSRMVFFDSTVLGRQHADVWEEGGKVYIKDVKSSNGTFIYGERLSSEGHESDPFELKTDNVIKFGIDIVGEENKTIIHPKVAACVMCVFTEQDAQVAARAEQHQQQQQRWGTGGGLQLGGIGCLGGLNGGVGGVDGLGGGGAGINGVQQQPQLQG
ncbi:hypothetical protein CVT25_001742 [Psilocybe cyanescens]|uniref:FHA domain-containing protein n=1 Tax=Psilocybe cyanescens TaxID=93625 RepID=A0A409XSL7_PSICY|nr:hypothetical protein CVT25_001742 [Psilocybe cyanescens]